MDWKSIITELQKHYTLGALAKLAGFASKGHLHDLKTGGQVTCSFERGQKLLELHREVMSKQGRMKRYYDEGWNAAHHGEPFDHNAFRDWRDGWNDYHDAATADKKPFPL